jgi:hypothetical protein
MRKRRRFISLVKYNIENKRKQSIRKTIQSMARKQIKSSYGSVHRALTYDIEIRPWKIARSQNINAT